MTWWASPQWRAYEAAGGYPSRVDELAAATWQTRVIDLTASEADLWRGVRKSYHALIHRVERHYGVGVWEPSGILTARALHDAEAGRETRPMATWTLMQDWIRQSRGLLVGACHAGMPVGYAYFLVHEDWAYYASAASRVPDVNHALAWLAIKTLKARGVRQLELGWQGHATDDKGRALEFFKRGFGGVDVPANWLAERRAA